MQKKEITNFISTPTLTIGLIYIANTPAGGQQNAVYITADRVYNIYNNNSTNVFMPLLYSIRSDISLTADTTVSINVTNRKLNIIKDGYM